MPTKTHHVHQMDTMHPTEGGYGRTIAWPEPNLVFASPDGIAMLTPASTYMGAGHTFTMVASQDLQTTAQGNLSVAVKNGLIFFTYGKATVPDKANKETGIAMHAATGSVNTQSQSAATQITADKAVDVSSTHGMVRINAPQHVLLTAAGAAIELKGGNITLKGPGKVEFKASMKAMSGPGGASASLDLQKPAALKGCAERLKTARAVGGASVSI